MERQTATKTQNGPARGNHVKTQSARSSSAAHPMLELQRSIGNQAVQRLIRSPYIQAKLQVSTPGDPFEQEADRVADTVMRMTESEVTDDEATLVQTKPLASRITPLVHRESEQPLEEEKEEVVATKPIVQRAAPLAVREDDEEEKISTNLDTSLSSQKEMVATKLATDAPLQRQAIEDEEKEETTLQTAPPIQRQTEQEDEEDPVQTKSLSSQLSHSPYIHPVTGSVGCAIQRLCTECEEEKQQGEGQSVEMVHRMSTPERLPDDDDVEEQQVRPRGGQTTTPKVSTSVAANIYALRGGGSPLPPATRAFFEPRFGADFSLVRVHTGARAEEAAKSIHAKAFTIGPNIAFGAGHYAPESAEGKRLVAHELVHTVQQVPQTSTVTTTDARASLLLRHPNDSQSGAQPGPAQDAPPGPTHPNYWLRVLSPLTFTRTNVIIQQGQGKTPLVVPAGGQRTQGFWEDLIDALKPRPCKFYICETVKVCKPPDPDPDPDKDDDFWKWWKWKCRDTQFCWCGLHEVPANSSDAALLTLATAPDHTRATISKSPLVQYFLHLVVGDSSWPLAQRVLAKAPSAAVPSLDEATWYLADHAIKSGNYPSALGVVLDSLVSRGVINLSLANWSHLDRKDKGEGVTNFTFVEDPVTHSRRATSPVAVTIYDPAFADVGLLFSTMIHEYVHVTQVLAGYAPQEFDDKGNQRPEFIARDELEAYLWEVEHALGSGMIKNPAQMKEVGKRLTDHFNALTPELQTQYKPRYDAAQRRVLEAAAGRTGMSIEDARRIVQETSQEIADLLKQRPGNETAIDTKIAAVRARRSEALIQVALVDNPNIQVVNPGEPGTYKVPTVDGEGKVRFLHGGIQVAWHMGQASTSAFTLGEGIGAGGRMAISGTAIQGRIHTFPPDIDFDEHIHVVAETRDQAGQKAAKPIIAKIRQISGGPVPGRTDLEFRHLITFPKFRVRMSLAEVRQADAEAKLARGIARLDFQNMTTYWRGFLADGRLTEVTRVVFVSANKSDGTELMKAGGSADLNLAFLEDPGEQPGTPLGQFAWNMCCEAVKRADNKEWLKASKRAYNYFSTIGDLANMSKLEPLFSRAETNVEQYAVVVDAIRQALVTVDQRTKQEGTRIITVERAQQQLETVALIVETILPNSGIGDSPAKIAKTLRNLARELRPRDAEKHLMLDDLLASKFAAQTSAIRVHINTGVEEQVKQIVNAVVRPVCPDKDKCKK